MRGLDALQVRAQWVHLTNHAPQECFGLVGVHGESDGSLVACVKPQCCCSSLYPPTPPWRVVVQHSRARERLGAPRFRGNRVCCGVLRSADVQQQLQLQLQRAELLLHSDWQRSWADDVVWVILLTLMARAAARRHHI